MSMVADLPGRFQWMVIGRRTSARASSARRFCVLIGFGGVVVARRARACRSCWPTIGLGGPTKLGLRDVAVEDEPLAGQTAHLGVAFLVAAHVRPQ